MRTGWNALFKLLPQTEEMEINDLMGQLAKCLQHILRKEMIRDITIQDILRL